MRIRDRLVSSVRGWLRRRLFAGDPSALGDDFFETEVEGGQIEIEWLPKRGRPRRVRVTYKRSGEARELIDETSKTPYDDDEFRARIWETAKHLVADYAIKERGDVEQRH